MTQVGHMDKVSSRYAGDVRVGVDQYAPAINDRTSYDFTSVHSFKKCKSAALSCI